MKAAMVNNYYFSRSMDSNLKHCFHRCTRIELVVSGLFPKVITWQVFRKINTSKYGLSKESAYLISSDTNTRYQINTNTHTHVHNL